MHIHNRYPLFYYEEVVRHIHEAEPDMVFITGDLVTKLKFLPLLHKILAPLGARHRCFAVLGNHDYWAGAEEIATTVRECGIDLLGNECRRIPLNGSCNLVLCGCEHPWNSVSLPIPQTSDDTYILALTHTPDNIYRLSAAGADVVFAGHYHAGQIRIPYLGSLVVPSIYGRRFDHGHFVVNRTHLFVTSGIGSVGFLFRLYCQPDIFIVDLK
jgi:predicted MPP superfamily phosphohydrolase